jgi:peptidoglycan/LPS O-acetylase OafA/YrhL
MASVSASATGATAGAAPEVVTPPPGNPRFPLLDSLRALAALGVLAAHVAVFTQNAQHHSYGVLLANLDIGVTVFFVLSGFLLFRPFLAAQFGLAPPQRLGRYAVRRFVRIVPAYWLALTVLTIYPGNRGVFSGDWWHYYLFLQFYSAHTAVRGLGIAWTLCIEVAFYVALPAYAWVAGRLTAGCATRTAVRRHLALLAVLSIASVALRVADRGVVMQNTLLTHWLWFAGGMALAVLSCAAQRGQALPRLARLTGERPAVAWGAAAVVYLGMCAALTSAPSHLFYSRSQETVEHVLSAVFAVLVVAPAVFGTERASSIRRLLATRPLPELGLISYGIYLWHASIALGLVRHDVQSWVPLLLATSALTVLAAGLSYRVVERPLIRAARRVQ